MSLQLVEAYFEHLSTYMVPWRKHDSPGKMKNLAPGTITRIQSCVYDLYRQRFETVQPEIAAFFCNFNRWYLIKISELMSADPPEFPVDAISMPLTHEAWRHLLLLIWQARPRKGCTWASISQLRTFLNVAKSMLGRSERVTRMRWAYLRWKKDALGGKIPTSKSDLGGKLSYLKLMYPSVEEPESCVVLCLALEICSKSRYDEPKSFDTIFCSAFRSSLCTNFRAFIDGLDEEDKVAMQVGTCKSLPITLHTPKRTGAVILHSCEAVHWNSCRQRGDHKIDTEDSYLKYPSEVQDGIMGRVLAGLEFGSHNFEAQAPHFSPEFSSTVPYDKLIPGYDKFPVELRVIYPFLIASIIWHYEWLKKTLPTDSPVWSSVPLFTTQQQWLEKLSAKDATGNFIHIFGGKAGAKSFLPLSGKSLMSSDHATLLSLNASFQEFLRSWNSRDQHSSGGAAAAPVVAAAPQLPIPAALTRKICEIHDMLSGNSVPVGGGRVEACPQLPIAQLSSSFSVPTGLRPDQLFRKWFCGLGQVPAWRHITKKQLPLKGPAGRTQRDLFNKYEMVMKYLIGPASSDQILKDIEGSFEACWARVCTAAKWPVTTRWSCCTVYDKLTPELRSKLDAAPPMQWSPVQIQAHAIGVNAVAALVQGLREGQANADAAAMGSIASTLAAADAAQLQANARISTAINCIPSAFRIPAGMTVEQWWTCWHTPCTISGLTARWRDCDLKERMRQLHHTDKASFPSNVCRSQIQLFVKGMEVMKVLRASVPGLTNDQIDADVGIALASCLAAASAEYGCIFDGAVRTVYNKVMSARKRAAQESDL